MGLPSRVDTNFAPPGPPGVRRDPYLGINFFVEIDGLVAGGFREVHGLESNVELKEYAEGGRNGYLHKLPGETRYPNLVLSRGLTDIDTLWSWYAEVSSGVVRRRHVTVFLLDAQRQPAMWWDVLDALPVKWVGPRLDAGGSEVAAESIELVHRGIVKPAPSRKLSAERAASAGPFNTP